MRVGAILSPVGDWQTILESAKIADAGGLDAVGFWDHYHSEKPEWAYVCGWSAYGMLAAATQRIKLTPMVICRLNYTLGVLAKESAILAIGSGGRFELGIGAGDYPIEYSAWHQPFPEAATRVEALAETIAALRLIWQGDAVNYSGTHVQLTDAACTPVPPVPPRVVAGVGDSRRMIRSADCGHRSRFAVLPHLSTVAHYPGSVRWRARNQCMAGSTHLDVSGPQYRSQFSRSSSRHRSIQAQNRHMAALACCVGAARPHRYSNALAQALGTQVPVAAVKFDGGWCLVA
jgi:Luciferase-like monooxygenase